MGEGRSRPDGGDACPPPGHAPGYGRRGTVTLLVGSGLAAVLPGGDARAADATPKDPPRAGDGLVLAAGERKGEPVTPADLAVDGPPVPAWPKDAASGLVKDQNRLNRVLLLRVDPAGLDEKTRLRSADGVVAYSDFCTHAGCFIELYKPAERVIFCHCHFSQFDPRAGGRVVAGPARRPLAALPLKLDGDRLVVAGDFVGQLGVPKA